MYPSLHTSGIVVRALVEFETFHFLNKSHPTYSQTCLKGSSMGRTKSGCLRQVTP